jgi:hypothetical protein
LEATTSTRSLISVLRRHVRRPAKRIVFPVTHAAGRFRHRENYRGLKRSADIVAGHAAAITVLGMCAVVSALCAVGALPGDSALFFLLLVLICAVIAVTAASSRRLLASWRWVAMSPLAVAALVWSTTFVLRPLELYVSPGDTIGPLTNLGFSLDDLSRTTALAALGCATWSLGYLGGLKIARRQMNPLPARSFPVSWSSSAVALVVGLFLSAALFERQGGLSALATNPGSLHVNQGSSFYGQFGIWLLIGTALYALAGVLHEGSQRSRRLLIITAPLAVLSPLGLASRGLVVLGLLGAFVIYVRFRLPTVRKIVLMATLAVVLAATLEFAAVVRTYAYSLNAWQATVRAVHTPPAAQQVADLSVFDDFVAMRALVPASIPWLNGQSLVQVPEALVPRNLWPAKPQPLDVQVTQYLTPESTAGMPISMQGEFFWNFGVGGVAAGCFVLGALFGAAVHLLFIGRGLALLLYAVMFGSTFSLITRALGTMTANTVIALVGVSFAFLVQPAGLTQLRRLVLRVGRDARPRVGHL